MEITLRKIDRENFRQAVRLKVVEGQEHFVASNAQSLAQAYAEPECVPLAVYDGETMVGFVMYAHDDEEGKWWIDHVMVEADYQGRGYGRAAMVVLMQLIGEQPGGDEMTISYVPENEIARKLYLSLGFVETGEMIEGETVACYRRL